MTSYKCKSPDDFSSGGCCYHTKGVKDTKGCCTLVSGEGIEL